MAKAPPCAKRDHGVLLVFGAPGPSGLFGPSKHLAHGALHRAVARPLQGLLPMTPPRDSRGRVVRPGPLPPHVILPVRRAVPPDSWPLQRHDCASR